jgi:hypothetical protein
MSIAYRATGSGRGAAPNRNDRAARASACLYRFHAPATDSVSSPSTRSDRSLFQVRAASAIRRSRWIACATTFAFAKESMTDSS